MKYRLKSASDIPQISFKISFVSGISVGRLTASTFCPFGHCSFSPSRILRRSRDEKARTAVFLFTMTAKSVGPAASASEKKPRTPMAKRGNFPLRIVSLKRKRDLCIQAVRRSHGTLLKPVVLQLEGSIIGEV